MKKSEYVSYDKVSEDINNCRDIHDISIAIIRDIRDKVMQGAYSLIKDGRASSPRFYKNYVATEKNINLLEEYDSGMELNMLIDSNKQLSRAIRN